MWSAAACTCAAATRSEQVISTCYALCLCRDRATLHLATAQNGMSECERRSPWHATVPHMHTLLQDQVDDFLDHALLLRSTSGACMTMRHGCKWPTQQAAKSNAS